jgi:hypothetical protein
MGAWDMLFAAELGASAALAGLLFVGLSINLARILTIPTLPNRALTALTLLVLILFTSTLFLVPGQPGWTLGIELLAVAAGGGYVCAALAWENRRKEHGRADEGYRRARRIEATLVALVFVFYLTASLLLLLGRPYAEDLVVSAFLLSFALAVLDAWVLLVEINR